MIDDIWGNSRLRGYSNRSPKDLNGVKVLLAVGSLGISGGTNLILQYAEALRLAGADVTIGFMLGKASDNVWHPTSGNLKILPLARCEDSLYDLIVATWWPTVYELPKLRASRYLYFVQSLESRFAVNFSDSLNEVRAAATYTFGIPMVTVASWLQNLLISETGTPTWFVRNGVDKKLFPIAPRNRGFDVRQTRVLVEGPLAIPMKAVDETIQAIDSIPGVEVWHVTPEKGGGSPTADRVFECRPLAKMSELYGDVDLLIKMSRVEGMFGPPLEAFHSGTSGIFSRVTGFDEYVAEGRNGLTVEVDDFETLRENLRELIVDRQLRERLSIGAVETARSWPSVQETANEFVACCYSVLASKGNPSLVRESIKSFHALLSNSRQDIIEIRALIPPSLFASM